MFVHLEGNANATLFYDKNGALIREIDVNPSLTATFFAPSTGESFSYPSAGPFIQEYVDGGAVGSPVIATLAGFLRGTGSTPPNAGRIVFDAVVIDTTPEGLPIVDLIAEVSASGHFNEDLAAAFCAALSG